MTRPCKIEEGLRILEELRNEQVDGSSLCSELDTAGLSHEETAEVLRRGEVWQSEARRLKASGYPYDELVDELLAIRAGWSDVARSLLAVGLAPPDVLRAALSVAEGTEIWPVLDVILLEGPEDADYEEVRGVIQVFFGRAAGVIEEMDLDDSQRVWVTERLGL